MNKDKKVSIIIPTFNRAQFLPKAIDSALSQTYSCEIIVCDHGSTDGTSNLMKKYVGKVKYIRKEEDYGPSFCWLDGVLQAKGDYIHLQFDDDWIKIKFIEESLKLFNKDVGFVFSSAEIYDESKKRIIKTLYRNLFRTGVYEVNKIESFALNNLISPAALLCHKNDMIDALYQGNLPMYKNTYHAVGPDYFITLLCILRYKKFGYVNESLAVFRSHDGSITVDASKSRDKTKKISYAYNDVKDYYFILKSSRILPLYKILKLFYWEKYQNLVKSVFKIILPKSLINRDSKNEK